MNGKTATNIATKSETLSEVINRTGEIEFSPANTVAWQDEVARMGHDDLAAWYGRIDNYAQTRLYLIITRALHLDEVMEISAKLHGSTSRIKVLEEKLARAQQASAAHYQQMIQLERQMAERDAKITELRNSVACQVEVNARLYDRATSAEAKLQSIRQVLT